MVRLVDLEASWKKVLLNEFSSQYMIDLRNFLLLEKINNKIIYPPGNLIFDCFRLTSFSDVKVVILGQDPYHGENQAHGLSFSVLPGLTLPMSLKNIYKELYNDLGINPSCNGCLVNWAKQGVLLLNSVLTVERNKPLSHVNIGWELFTDKVISSLSVLSNKKIVFVLWGSYAFNKVKNIDLKKHYIISSSHPSPYSAYRGFFGSKPFSRINMYLNNSGESAIDWKII